MTNEQIDRLGTDLANRTMTYAAAMLRKKGLGSKDVDLDALVIALRREIKNRIDEIFEESEKLSKGGMGGWVAELVNAHCMDAATEALVSIGIDMGTK